MCMRDSENADDVAKVKEESKKVIKEADDGYKSTKAEKERNDKLSKSFILHLRTTCLVSYIPWIFCIRVVSKLIRPLPILNPGPLG